MPTLTTAAVLFLSFACALVWGKPPVKPQKSYAAVPPSAEQQYNEVISDVLPGVSGMEAILASKLCSGLWTHSTLECCFPPSPQPLHECRFCARTYKSNRGLTNHENKCKSKPRLTLHNEPSPAPSGSSFFPDDTGLEEVCPLNKEPPLTLAECSRLVSAYVEHSEWQEFLAACRT